MPREYVVYKQTSKYKIYTGYVLDGKPDGIGNEYYVDRVYFGQWSGGNKHGVFLVTDDPIVGDTFTIELYENDKYIKQLNYFNSESDEAYCYNKLEAQINKLPDNNFTASSRFYNAATAYLSEQSSCRDASSLRDLEAKLEEQNRAEKERQSELKYLEKQYSNAKEAEDIYHVEKYEAQISRLKNKW